MREITYNQARALAFIKTHAVASSRAIADALMIRITDASLIVRQLERVGLVELSFTRINRSKAMAHAQLTPMGFAA